MSRAQRRREQREKVKKRFLTDEEIKKIKTDATDEAFEKVFGVLFTLPYLTLREFGYGKKRLGRFHDRMCHLLKEVEKGNFDLNDSLENLKTKYGIVYVSKGDGSFEVGVDGETNNEEKFKSNNKVQGVL